MFLWLLLEVNVRARVEKTRKKTYTHNTHCSPTFIIFHFYRTILILSSDKRTLHKTSNEIKMMSRGWKCLRIFAHICQWTMHLTKMVLIFNVFYQYDINWASKLTLCVFMFIQLGQNQAKYSGNTLNFFCWFSIFLKLNMLFDLYRGNRTSCARFHEQPSRLFFNVTDLRNRIDCTDTLTHKRTHSHNAHPAK